MTNTCVLDDVVTTNEAMKILASNRMEVMRLVERGALRYVQRGRRGGPQYTFKRADVEHVRDLMGEHRRLSRALGFKVAP